jgi:hypothetical protein
MPKLARHDLMSGLTVSITGTRTRCAVEGMRGLILDVSVKGKRTWVLRYQTGHGDKRRLRYRRIGDATVMGLAQAVDRARKIKALLTARRDGKTLERQPLRAATLTVAELVDEFLLRHVRVKLRPATANHYANYLARFVLPAIGDRLAADVRKHDILALVDTIATQRKREPRLARGGKSAMHNGGTPRLPDHVRAIVSAMFGWAEKRNILDANPALGAGNVGSSPRSHRATWRSRG